MQPVFRFAPSPNGALHLGHALSALINFEAAKATGGRFHVRIEDIDTIRCTEDKVEQMLSDLRWLGLDWQEPVVRQSQRFDVYQANLATLRERDLIYPSTASRKDIQSAIQRAESETGEPWPRDPDGAPLFPREKLADREQNIGEVAWRLDLQAALRMRSEVSGWSETGPLSADYPAPAIMKQAPDQWGDVILARKDCPTSYHLSVVLDDAMQGITHVVRGQDLFAATSLHRLLQDLFGLPAPIYHHHRLLTDRAGEKLSKSRGDLSLASLRKQGETPDRIRKLVNFNEEDIAAFIAP